MLLVAGVDLVALLLTTRFSMTKKNSLTAGLCEHPARSTEGPAICLQQIADGLKIAVEKAGVSLSDVAVVGLDTPGPASATGVLSTHGSTNFVHPDWASFDIRGNLSKLLGKPTVYLNDANAAALWGHFALFGSSSKTTSISNIIRDRSRRRHHHGRRSDQGPQGLRRGTGPRFDSLPGDPRH